MSKEYISVFLDLKPATAQCPIYGARYLVVSGLFVYERDNTICRTVTMFAQVSIAIVELGAGELYR